MNNIIARLSSIVIGAVLAIGFRTLLSVPNTRLSRTLFASCLSAGTLLAVQYYVPELLAPLVTFYCLIAWIVHKQKRFLYGRLTGLGIIAIGLPPTYQSLSIILIIITVLREEIAKIAGAIRLPEQKLPYDGLLIGLLLGTGFGWIEASWAGIVVDSSQVRMRATTSLIIHTIATTLLMTTLSDKSMITSLGIVVLALGVHSGYNLLQSSLPITLLLVGGSYLLLSYWISKIDRVYVSFE